MTPQNIKDLVRNQANETAAAFWSDAEIYSYMRAGEILLADETNSFEKTDTSTTTVASTADYTRPTDVVNILYVTWDDFPLTKVDVREWDLVRGAVYGSATNTEGRPSHYREFGSTISLYPTPSEAKTLKYFYTAQPTLKTDASTSFDIPQQLAPFLIPYCLWQMYLKDSEDSKANVQRGIWEENLKKAKKQWRERKRRGKFAQVKDQDLHIETDLSPYPFR